MFKRHTVGTRSRTAQASRRGIRLALEQLEDRCVPASLSISDVTVLEGDSGTRNAAVVVSLSEPRNKTVTVNYSTADGTAAEGSDYDRVSGKLTFARGASRSLPAACMR